MAKQNINMRQIRVVRLLLTIAILPVGGMQFATRRLFLAESTSVLGGASLASNERAMPEVRRTTRPLFYKIVPGQPSTMQPYLDRAEGQVLRSIAQESACVLLGVKTSEGRADPEDMECALGIANQLAQRRKLMLAVDSTTALGVPSLDCLNVGVDSESMRRVQAFGLEGLEERSKYVPDPDQFINFQNTNGFRIYADRVLARKYNKLNISKIDGAPSQQNYIASVLLRQHAAAALIQSYLKTKPSDLVVAILSDDLVKFRLGTQARLLNMGVDPCTSILCNPTADSTYSLSSRLRLDISLRSELLSAPVADYISFSDSPAPSLLNHMMNPIDGNPFKIDFGLSTGGT